MNGIGLRLLTGDIAFLDLPEQGEDESEAAVLLDKACNAIVVEWSARDRAGSRASNEWLKAVCYRLIEAYVKLDLSHLFQMRIKEHGRDPQSQSVKTNVFSQGLLCIFANHKGALDASDRATIGRQLWFAFRHYVPHEFLIGFLHQTGAMNESEFDIDPDFDVWILAHRIMDPIRELRGAYPDRLEGTNFDNALKLLPMMAEHANRKAASQRHREEL